MKITHKPMQNIRSQNIRSLNEQYPDHLVHSVEEETQPEVGIMQFEEITKKIIGCAYRVYNKMGFGFLESVYEKCMLIELEKAGLNAKAQQPISVYYDSQIVGEFVADIIVEDKIIVELKSVRAIVQAHEIQLVNYLVATNTEVGLLLNFGEQKVEVKRKLRTLE